MKWSFVIHQKLKAAILLGTIMLFIVAAAVLTKHTIDGINKSFSSIYQDRLLPATTIIYLTENLYAKRLVMEKHLSENRVKNHDEMESLLAYHDHKMDSLIAVFEKSYLVEEERKSLLAFRKYIKAYQGVEKSLLNESLHISNSRSLFDGQGQAYFQQSLDAINKLTEIQSSVGTTLLKDSKMDFTGIAVISFLQIALSIIIGIVILILIQSSRIVHASGLVKDKSGRFNLN